MLGLFYVQRLNMIFDNLYIEYVERVKTWRKFHRINEKLIESQITRLVCLLKKRSRKLDGYYSVRGDRLIINGKKETVRQRGVRIGSYQAVRAVVNLIDSGRLLSLKDNYIECVDCGKRAVHYEHRDYNKPENVDPVCIACNARRGAAIYLNN